MALVGLEGRIVEVEADIGSGLPRTVLVGLPDSALYQARDRCKAAVSNSGQEWPISLLTINLSPATLPKAGSHYDLAIVAAMLAAQDVFPAVELRRTVLLGELGLDGRVRPVRGVLPATLAAEQAGFTRVIVPLRQSGEAKLVDGHRGARRGVAQPAGGRSCSGEPMPEVEPIEVDRASRRSATEPANSTSPTWSARWRPSGRARWRRRAAITCSSTVRPGSARRCSPSGCPACCPTWTFATRWRSRPCTRWPGSTWPTS